MTMIGYRFLNQDANVTARTTIIARLILSLAVSDFLVGVSLIYLIHSKKMSL